MRNFILIGVCLAGVLCLSGCSSDKDMEELVNADVLKAATCFESGGYPVFVARSDYSATYRVFSCLRKSETK